MTCAESSFRVRFKEAPVSHGHTHIIGPKSLSIIESRHFGGFASEPEQATTLMGKSEINLYRISVYGTLNTQWVELPEGMDITITRQGHQKAVTTLIGTVPNQEALLGILNTLYELHMPLIAVELLDNEE